jgi:hypothetical protein
MEERDHWKARAEQAEAEADGWHDMYLMKWGECAKAEARAEKAEAELAELEEIDEVCRAETKRADYWKAEAEKARAAIKEQGQ